MLFLHGFPEFWYSWRHQIPGFAKDHKVVAVDLRGYNDSDKPKTQSAYVMSEFVEDVKGVIEGLGYESCFLVGHDWGGVIACSFAYAYPELVSRLIVMNLPHPAKFAAGLKRGKRGIRKKSDAKCENIAHIDNKCTLIMTKVIASEIKVKH